MYIHTAPTDTLEEKQAILTKVRRLTTAQPDLGRAMLYVGKTADLLGIPQEAVLASMLQERMGRPRQKGNPLRRTFADYIALFLASDAHNAKTYVHDIPHSHPQLPGDLAAVYKTIIAEYNTGNGPLSQLIPFGTNDMFAPLEADTATLYLQTRLQTQNASFPPELVQSLAKFPTVKLKDQAASLRTQLLHAELQDHYRVLRTAMSQRNTKLIRSEVKQIGTIYVKL
jgi:hypothetical protein